MASSPLTLTPCSQQAARADAAHRPRHDQPRGATNRVLRAVRQRRDLRRPFRQVQRTSSSRSLHLLDYSRRLALHTERFRHTAPRAAAAARVKSSDPRVSCAWLVVPSRDRAALPAQPARPSTHQSFNALARQRARVAAAPLHARAEPFGSARRSAHSTDLALSPRRWSRPARTLRYAITTP